MKNPMKNIIFTPQPTVVKSKDKDPILFEDDDMLTTNFEIGLDDELCVIYNGVDKW